MRIDPDIFREYDIRGVALAGAGKKVQLDNETAECIGKAFAVYLAGQKKHNTVCVGRDGRLTSPSLSRAVIRGITSGGIDVIDIGQVPTPLLYFALFNLKVDGGIMITGSHNPKEDNGMKVAVDKATIYGKEIQKLGQIAMAGKFPKARKTGAVSKADVVPKYIERVASDIHLNRKLTIAVDAGNGVGGVVAVPLYRKLGCEVTPLFCEVDGSFPHHHPDPTLPKSLDTLLTTVANQKADCGIALDGDADRIGVVDNKGDILWGDKILTLFARSVLEREPGAAVIGEVKCSRTLYEDIEKHGGKPVMWKTGHSLIKAAIKKFKAQLAGEMSGHMFFKHRWYGFDDAIYAGARLLEILATGRKSLHSRLADIPKTYVTPEIRIDTNEARKFEIVKKATEYFKAQGFNVNTIDGARIEFDDGWGLLRASNTSPKLVMRCEAYTKRRLDEIRALVERKVSELNR